MCVPTGITSVVSAAKRTIWISLSGPIWKDKVDIHWSMDFKTTRSPQGWWWHSTQFGRWTSGVGYMLLGHVVSVSLHSAVEVWMQSQHNTERLIEFSWNLIHEHEPLSSGGWRDGLAVDSSCCSLRGLVPLQYLHGNSKLSNSSSRI